MSVTAICTLWGRPLHSLRWMWHMNRIRFPHPILLADGGPEQGLEAVLRDRALFPHLDYEYLRFRDRSIDDYYRKVVTASEHATTPYVLLCDNDDFVLPAGIAPAVAALDGDAGVVAAGGRVVSFGLARRHWPSSLDQVAGRVTRFVQGGTYESVREPGALERVGHLLQRNVYNPYYSVQRRDVFTQAWTRLRASGITALDIGVGEFLACQVLACGSVATDPGTVIHLRQLATSSVGASLTSSAERWDDPLWQADLERMGRGIGAAVAAADGIAEAEAEARVLAWMRAKRSPKPHHYTPPEGLSAVLRRLFRASGGRALLEQVRIARDNAGAGATRRRSLAESLDLLAAGGAGAEALARHQADLAEMEATLASPELAAFIAAYGPRVA